MPSCIYSTPLVFKYYVLLLSRISFHMKCMYVLQLLLTGTYFDNMYFGTPIEIVTIGTSRTNLKLIHLFNLVIQYIYIYIASVYNKLLVTPSESHFLFVYCLVLAKRKLGVHVCVRVP